MDARRREFYIFRERRIPKDCPDFDTLAVLYHDTREEKYLAWMLNLYETKMNAIAIAAAMHYDMDGYFSDFKDCIVHGIYKAMEHFEPSREVKFSTFMSWYLKEEIHVLVRTLRRGFSGMSKSMDEQFRKAMAIYKQTASPLADRDTMERIAGKIGCSRKVLSDIIDYGQLYSELIWYDKGHENCSCDEDNFKEAKDYIPDPGGSAETVYFKERCSSALWDAYHALTAQEQEMVAAYLGFCPECGSSFRLEEGKLIPRRPMFFADIAAIHQMYEPRTAKKIIDNALGKMRERLIESGWYTVERYGPKTKKCRHGVRENPLNDSY